MTDHELSTLARDAHLVALYIDGVPVRLIAEQTGFSRNMVHGGLCRALGLPSDATMTQIDDLLYQEALKERLGRLRRDEDHAATDLMIKIIAMLSRLQGLGTINVAASVPYAPPTQTSTDRVRAAIDRIRARRIEPPSDESSKPN
jgi:hypothetical protein